MLQPTRPIQALLVTMPKRAHALLLRALEHARDGVDPEVEHVDRRPKREPDKVVARRREQVPAVRRVDVEEDAGHADAFLLQEFLEERLQPVLFSR